MFVIEPDMIGRVMIGMAGLQNEKIILFRNIS